MSSAHKSNPHTVEILRGYGFLATTVECRIEVHSKAWADKYKNPRRDVFGIFDIIAMRPDQGIFAIQATDAQDTYKHRAKMLKGNTLQMWIESGGRAQIWQWGRGLKGTRPVCTLGVLEAKIIDGQVTFVSLARDEWLVTLGDKAPPVALENAPARAENSAHGESSPAGPT
jgi:hypothetical protein